MAANIENKQKPSTYGVTIGTWGTVYGAKRGYWNEIKALLGFGNLGTQHARVTLTIPDNETTRKWVEEYCKNPSIPHEFRKRIVKQMIVNKNGKLVPSDKSAFEENAIVINFSWCKSTREDEIPYTIPGFSGDSYIKGMKLKINWKTLKWAGFEKGLVWKNKKVATLQPKIHHIDRIVNQVFQEISTQLEIVKKQVIKKEDTEKLQKAITEMAKLNDSIDNILKKFLPSKNLIKSIENIDNTISTSIEKILGEPLLKKINLSKTPIQDLLKKHAKHTTAEDEMMLIGSGLAPSHQVHLPIKTLITHNSKQQEESSDLGALDVESMLKAMHKIAKEGVDQKKGWTVSRNCSETARRILFAGIIQGDKELEEVFKERISITSPQKLLNWALNYQKLITAKNQTKAIKPVYELYKTRDRKKAVHFDQSKMTIKPARPLSKSKTFFNQHSLPIESKNKKAGEESSRIAVAKQDAFIEELKTKLKSRPRTGLNDE